MKPRRSQTGFSLIEIMVATLILGFALAGLAQAVTTAMASNKDSELLANAAFLAAGQIEILRADSFLTAGTTEGQGSGRLSIYSWSQTVARSDLDGLYDVDVTVSNSKTGEVIYQLKTKLFDPPIVQTDREAGKDEKSKRGNRAGGRRNR